MSTPYLPKNLDEKRVLKNSGVQQYLQRQVEAMQKKEE
jgi:hypothetical protein